MNGDTDVTAIFGLHDSDGDGTLDCNDAFPDDPDEAFDGDGDGIGDNADTDHDNDGMLTEWENENGLDPLTDDAGLDPDGDGLSNLVEYQMGSDPRAATSGPGMAVLVSPDDQAAGLSLSLSFETGYGQTADKSRHAGTMWQIGLDTDFTDLVLDVISRNYKTGLTVPVGVLDPYLTYYWRAGYVGTDGLIWPWSESRSFVVTQEAYVDENGNGIPDDQELEQGTRSDLDGDGENDLSQEDM